MVPDVDVPGNLLYIRLSGDQTRIDDPVTESSWIAVVVRQPRSDREEPHCVYMPSTESEDPMYVYFGRVKRLDEVTLLSDNLLQVTEVLWARQA